MDEKTVTSTRGGQRAQTLLTWSSRRTFTGSAKVASGAALAPDIATGVEGTGIESGEIPIRTSIDRG
jgi:hypothetical protein